MKKAGIAQEGTPHDLYDRPASAFAGDFIGDANRIEVEVIRSGDETEILLLDRRLCLPLASTATGADPAGRNRPPGIRPAGRAAGGGMTASAAEGWT